MGEKLLIISDKKKDLELLKELLYPQGFSIEGISHSDHHAIEDAILNDSYSAILADFDLIGESVSKWIELLQENRSRACFILYGEEIRSNRISEILQKGAYGFVNRDLLSERIYETLLGGLENRKTFIDILGMIDELKEVNERLKKEKETLRKRNQELTFINQLSSEVAYDLNWDRILPRILDAGLLSVIDPEVFCLLYNIGSRWNLAFYLSEKEITKETILRLSVNIIDRFFALSEKRIMTNEIDLHLYPSDVKVSPSPPISLSKSALVKPLSIAEYLLGMLLLIPKGGRGIKNGTEEVLSTISNILAISLKNAQEYHNLRQMTVTDSLTSVYNHKGFREFIQREFKRAKRYNKALSLIMVDVDNFKAINDSFGHQTGDYILQELAECLKGSVRNTDIVTRYGGDEFAVLLPEAGTKEAEVLVERIVHTLKNHTFQWGSEVIQVEISFGISTTDELEKDEKEEALINRADSRLYAAKRSRQTLYSISRGA